MIHREEKIKVAHIITRLDTGGSATNTIETVARLDPAKYDVFLISGRTQDPGGTIEDGLKQKNIRYTFVDALQRSIHPIKDLAVLIKLYQRIKKEKYTIVHTHSSKAGILGRWAAKWAGIPVIIHTPHGHVFYGYFNRWVSSIFIWIEQMTATITDQIITLTERGRQEHVDFKIGPLEKFVVIPSGIDLTVERSNTEKIEKLRQEWKIPHGRKVFGVVARLDPIKGIEYLLEAMVIVVKRDPDCHLLIVGDGSQAQILKQQATDLGISHHVTFTGHQNAVRQWIQIMDVFVLPSINEGMGRVLLDAMLLAKAVIATEVGGVPDIVENGKTGVLVAPKNSQALAEAMLQLKKDAELTRQMGEQGLKKVTRDFSLEIMVEKISRLYEDCLLQRGKNI